MFLVVATSVRMNRTYSRLFAQLGARKDDIVQIDRPLHAAEVIFPDLPMLRRTWLHPETWEVLHALREMGRQSTVGTPERVYISRSRVARRGLVNEPAVEDLFREKGFTIVHPQELPIEDQICIFANARFLASAGGSAAHNALFAPQQARVLIQLGQLACECRHPSVPDPGAVGLCLQRAAGTPGQGASVAVGLADRPGPGKGQNPGPFRHPVRLGIQAASFPSGLSFHSLCRIEPHSS